MYTHTRAREYIQARTRSLRFPDFVRTWRSTVVVDMSAKVSPDIMAATNTKKMIIAMYRKKFTPQHL